MNILVAVASKHGSTREIAETITGELHAAGHAANIYDVAKAPAPERFDAAVIGSAIYMGRWMAEAQDYVVNHEEQLRALPVWLFSSGPLGEDYPEGMGKPENLDDLMARTGARDHEVFVGRLDRDELSMSERLISRVVKSPEGDFRDWDAIRSWARSIAESLS